MRRDGRRWRVAGREEGDTMRDQPTPDDMRHVREVLRGFGPETPRERVTVARYGDAAAYQEAKREVLAAKRCSACGEGRMKRLGEIYPCGGDDVLLRCESCGARLILEIREERRG
jgi:hypothetical protein